MVSGLAIGSWCTMALSAGQCDLKTGHMTVTAKCDIHMELHTTEMKKWGRSWSQGSCLLCCRTQIFLVSWGTIAEFKKTGSSIEIRFCWRSETTLETGAFAGTFSQFSSFNNENDNEPLSWLIIGSSQIASVELIECSSAQAVLHPIIKLMCTLHIWWVWRMKMSFKRPFLSRNPVLILILAYTSPTFLRINTLSSVLWNKFSFMNLEITLIVGLETEESSI